VSPIPDSEAGVASAFDFEGFRAAFEARDVAAWVAHYAPEAEWLEYRHDAPPRSPHRMSGRAQILRFLEAIGQADIQLRVSDEVVTRNRVAFLVTVAFPDGRRVLEHVMLYLRDGLIVRQVDIEAWD
jgi:hypothetical protein